MLFLNFCVHNLQAASSNDSETGSEEENDINGVEDVSEQENDPEVDEQEVDLVQQQAEQGNQNQLIPHAHNINAADDRVSYKEGCNGFNISL